MEKKIAQLKGHYVVCGMGQIGGNVAQELALTGREFVMVDMNKANLQSYVEQHPTQLYVLGDATDNEVLQAAGIQHARGVFAVAHDDNQNLVISLSAKQLNPQVRVIARCHDQKNVAKIRSAGADEIVLLDFTGGLRLVSVMVRPNVVGFLDEMMKAEGDLRMEEVVIPERMNGKPLSMLHQGKQDCLVIALQQHGSWQFNPAADCTLQGGDVLMAMVTPNGRASLERLMQNAA